MSTNSTELFLQACRWAGPLRLSVEHPDPELATERVVHQPFALVGCDPRMDLFLNHALVNRRHAYLQILGGKLFCVDLQSRSGVQFQGRWKRSGWLEFEEALGIGPFWVRALGGGEEAPSPAHSSALESPGEEELPLVALEFVNRLPRPTVWRMATMLALVGRAPLCRVRLMGSSVSKFHCSLVLTPLGLWVVDLFGKGGISVNSTPVRSARLEDGDCLQVGNFIIRARYLQPAPARIPFSHLADATGPILELQGSSVSLPALQETFSHQALGQMESVPSFPVTPGTEAALANSLALFPPFLANPSEGALSNTDIVQSLLVPVAQQLGIMQQQMFDQFQQAMLMMFQMFGKLQREQLGVIRDEMERLHELSREVLALQTELANHVQPPAERARPASAAPGQRAVAANHPSRPALAAKDGAQTKPLPLPQGQPEKDMHAWLSQRLAALQQERQTRWQKIVNYLTGKANERSTP